MNLRISKNQFRFRITKEELLQLMAGERLEESAAHLRFGITPVESGQSLFLDDKDGGINLVVSKLDLAELSRPVQEGLDVTIGKIRVVLEVDIATQSRSRVKPVDDSTAPSHF